jgi:hypothetical protein
LSALLILIVTTYRFHISAEFENRNPRAAIEAKGLASGFSDNGLQAEKLGFDFDATGAWQRWTAMGKFGT